MPNMKERIESRFREPKNPEAEQCGGVRAVQLIPFLPSVVFFSWRAYSVNSERVERVERV